jgi:hypothetical protein
LVISRELIPTDGADISYWKDRRVAIYILIKRMSQEEARPKLNADLRLRRTLAGDFLLSRQVDVQPKGKCFTKVVYKSFHVYGFPLIICLLS